MEPIDRAEMSRIGEHYGVVVLYSHWNGAYMIFENSMRAELMSWLPMSEVEKAPSHAEALARKIEDLLRVDEFTPLRQLAAQAEQA